MRRLILVGCCSTKLSEPRPARYIYQSPLFLKAKAYADSQRCEWAILSAKYGLVQPMQVIAPYDEQLKAKTLVERAAWTERVSQQLQPWKDYSIEVLAGASYCDWSPGFKVELPMKGLNIGQRLQWLNDNTN